MAHRYEKSRAREIGDKKNSEGINHQARLEKARTLDTTSTPEHSPSSKIAMAQTLDVVSIANRLLASEIVTVPTETVEGYAVALNSKKGVNALMLKKERGFDSGKVFTLVPEAKEAAQKYALVSPLAGELIQAYFPGELTLLLPKNPNFRHFYFDHFDKIGLRIPNHELFPSLLKAVGPLLLTSANPKGGTPRSLTGHLPSTIIDLTETTPQIVRQGNLIIKL